MGDQEWGGGAVLWAVWVCKRVPACTIPEQGFYLLICCAIRVHISIRGDVKILSLLATFHKNTEPSEGTSYPVSDLCQCFTKLTGSSAYVLHSNLISPTYRTNGLL